MLNKVNKYTREKSFDPEVVGAVSKVADDVWQPQHSLEKMRRA